MGSGSLNAMAMFEAYYKDDLSRQVGGCSRGEGLPQRGVRGGGHALTKVPFALQRMQ